MKSSMVGDKQNIFKSVCEPAYACYQGKGNKHQYLFFLKNIEADKVSQWLYKAFSHSYVYF